MDVAVFTWINGFAERYTILDGMMIFVSKWLIYLLIGILIIHIFIPKKRTFSLIGICGTVLGVGLKYLITLVYVRPRPFVEHDVILLIEKAPSASFPSITALIAFVAATALWMMYQRAGSIFFLIAALVAISRLYVGHHYPSDVLAGSIMGVLITYMCLRISRRFFEKK